MPPLLDAVHEPMPATMPLRTRLTLRDWRNGLPVLAGGMAVLRDLRVTDAPALLEALNTEEVARFISPPPTTVNGFERFISWTHQERAAGRYACFAVTVAGSDAAIGVFQVRQLGVSFDTAEWGFAVASAFWGTGLFVDAARLVLDFSFDTLHIRRLEARASRLNARGNGALRKLGAMHEGVLHGSFLRNGELHDQFLWAILDSDWHQRRTVQASAPVDSFRVTSARRPANT